jgi:hypothetical protein
LYSIILNLLILEGELGLELGLVSRIRRGVSVREKARERLRVRVLFLSQVLLLKIGN